MQVWNVLHAARWKYRTQKWRQKSPSRHHRTTLTGYIFATKAYINYRKKNLLNSNISSTCPHNMANFGPLAAKHYCSDVVHWRPTKLCKTFGRLLGSYTIYTFSGALAPWWNFATCIIHFTSKSCVFLYWHAALLHGTPAARSAKLCGMVQGME